jgi:hypothetical protein
MPEMRRSNQPPELRRVLVSKMNWRALGQLPRAASSAWVWHEPNTSGTQARQAVGMNQTPLNSRMALLVLGHPHAGYVRAQKTP